MNWFAPQKVSRVPSQGEFVKEVTLETSVEQVNELETEGGFLHKRGDAN